MCAIKNHIYKLPPDCSTWTGPFFASGLRFFIARHRLLWICCDSPTFEGRYAAIFFFFSSQGNKMWEFNAGGITPRFRALVQIFLSVLVKTSTFCEGHSRSFSLRRRYLALKSISGFSHFKTDFLKSAPEERPARKSSRFPLQSSRVDCPATSGHLLWRTTWSGEESS